MSITPRRRSRPDKLGGPRIAIGVTTFNRRRMVEECGRSLCAVRGIENCRLLVVDDASEEYGREFLQGAFPAHAEVTRRSENSGRADFAAIYLYEQLCSSASDLIISLDSDLLVASDALFVVSQLIGETDGVLALFNTPSHPETPSRRRAKRLPPSLYGDSLIEKVSIGNAGVAWRPDVLEDVLKNVPPSTAWDWDFCRYLTENKRSLYALRRSVVQHLGFAGGQNSTFVRGDYGIGFEDYGPDHTRAMFEAIVFGLQGELGAMQARLDRLATSIDAALAAPRGSRRSRPRRRAS